MFKRKETAIFHIVMFSLVAMMHVVFMSENTKRKVNDIGKY